MQQTRAYHVRPRDRDWLQHIQTRLWSDEEMWRHAFHFQKATFEYVLALVTEKITGSSKGPNPLIDPHTKLLLDLNWLAQLPHYPQMTNLCWRITFVYCIHLNLGRAIMSRGSSMDLLLCKGPSCQMWQELLTVPIFG